nr:TonB-dependent receptor [Fodinibius halophilus]
MNNKADNGKIVGKVVDAKTGEAIIGANVSITGTTKGAATDLDGKYAIRDVAPGFYSITVSYISYAKKTITGVEVGSGQKTKLNITLQPETIGLEEVKVTARASSNNEAGLLSIQRKAVAVQDGLSSEFLGKTGDGNVASAMKRVTGVSLVNGNDVYVRGLGNRYSNIQLNGAQVPSTSPTEKEAPVDLVGSGLVDNVVVQKTFTPDQSGEFSGGSVQITTSEFPDAENLTLSYSTSLNTISAFNDMLYSPGSATDFIGFDSGKRALPSMVKGDRLTTTKGQARFANQVHTDWTIRDSKKALPSQKIGVSYANQYNQDKMPIGLVANFNYKYDRQYKPAETLNQLQTASENTASYISKFEKSTGTENVKLGGMMNLFIKPNDVTKIGFKNLYSNSLENSGSILTGSYYNYQNSTPRQTVSSFDRKAIFATAIEFDTYIERLYSSRISANINYSRAERDQPDRRTTLYNDRTTDDVVNYKINLGSSEGGNTHYFANQEDNNYSAEVDYELKPFPFLKVKAGGSGMIKERSFDARRFTYVDNPDFSAPAYPEEDKNADPSIALRPELVENEVLEIRENTVPDDSYIGDQTLWAGYLSTVWTALKNTTLEVGARVEISDQEVSYEEPISNSSGEQLVQISNVENTDFLPAVNLSYSLSDKTNLRGAFSQTLARPDFREISNFSFTDFIGGEKLIGNPKLKRTKITNYDLRFETYPDIGELFALSVFYKDFQNPIEKIYRPIFERAEIKFVNGKEAQLYGLEVEGRKNVLPELQLVANASFIFSETTVKKKDVDRVANEARPMFGQSPYTVNFGAYYSILEWNLDLSANYNTFGKRIVTIGNSLHPDDEYEKPFHNLSLKADYRAGSTTLSFSVSNLLNDTKTYEQGGFVTYKYKPGLTFDFGLKLSF